VLNEELRQKLIQMRAEDLRVRQELVEAGELGGTYVPRMEAIHISNAAALKELIRDHGWPNTHMVGEDGAEAAWLIVQHSIGDPEFQRQCLKLLVEHAADGSVPQWQVAYLEDRVNMQQGQPQRFGTQWLDDPLDGRVRPWTLADPERVNQLRAEAGMKPVAPVPERGPDLPPDQRQAIEENHRWWQEWQATKGWRS
jgi:hypothetical protein